MKRNHILWLVWITATLTGGTALAATMYYGGYRGVFLIGKTTIGHHQIELACDACHTDPFGGKEALQKSCMNCHGAELKAANDSHPRTKFTDPRNADRVAKLDARYCVTCHREHEPGITHAMGVTMPNDYCALCHQDIAKDRPSHKGLAFDTCASAGCHNFHDNRALYEDFLGKHAHEPDFKDSLVVKLVNWTPPADSQQAAKKKPLTAADADAPDAHKGEAKFTTDWAASAHAAAGVNCSGCHMPRKNTRPDEWLAKPDRKVCETCHAPEAKTFTEGKHGMRQRDGLWVERKDPFGIFKDVGFSSMTPGQAWIPMKADVHDKALTCNTCHGAHRYDTKTASIDACESCHADDHTKAYRQSPHYSSVVREAEGELPKGSGVTCATCHMPRVKLVDDYGAETVYVTHNQNDNLRPNEKMIRSVCADCHGLGFAIDALADPALEKNNYKGRPHAHIESIDWVEKRMREKGTLR